MLLFIQLIVTLSPTLTAAVPLNSMICVSLLCATNILKVSLFDPVFEPQEDLQNKSFFSEIITSISDCKFSHNGRYIATRDYLTVKIWDVNMESRPVKVIDVHDHLKGKLCDLYENDCIFDKFECNFSGDARYTILTQPVSHRHV